MENRCTHLLGGGLGRGRTLTAVQDPSCTPNNRVRPHSATYFSGSGDSAKGRATYSKQVPTEHTPAPLPPIIRGVSRENILRKRRITSNQAHQLIKSRPSPQILSGDFGFSSGRHTQGSASQLQHINTSSTATFKYAVGFVMKYQRKDDAHVDYPYALPLAQDLHGTRHVLPSLEEDKQPQHANLRTT